MSVWGGSCLRVPWGCLFCSGSVAEAAEESGNSLVLGPLIALVASLSENEIIPLKWEVT